MLTKLIKHEFKSSYRNYLPIFIAVLISTIFLALSFSNKSIQGVAYSMMFVMIVVVTLYVMMFVNIFKSLGERMYGKPGYLLFTVPAKTRDIVLSRVIANFIWVLLSTIIAAIPFAVFMMYITGLVENEGAGQSTIALDLVLSILGVQKDANAIEVILGITLRMFEFLQLIAAIFVSFTISYTLYRGDKKKLIQIVIFFALVIAVNSLLSSALFTTSEIIPGQFGEGTLKYKTTAQMSYAIIFELLFCTGAFIGSGYLIDQKLELQ